MTDTIRIPVGPSGAVVAWATVDVEDYERLIAHRWYLAGRGYAFRTLNGRSVFMHRDVLDFPDSESVNHINGDQLDNRRENLEACTQRHNAQVGPHATVFQQRDRIRELRLDGWTAKAIAAEIGTTPASVYKYVSDLPTPLRESKVEWTRERLIASLQSFVSEHGRFPGNADWNGKNGHPWWSTVYRRFDGGLIELRECAGFGRVDLRVDRSAA